MSQQPPVAIHEAPITDPAAWIGAKIGAIEHFSRPLTPQHVDALREVVKRTADLPRDLVTRDRCGHPALDRDLAAILDEVQGGTGLVLLRGFPVESEPLDTIERMFWIVGLHLGMPLSQYAAGQTLVRVQEEKPKDAAQSSRGSKASQELAMHTDICEVMGLLCVRDAAEGGESQLASTLAVHNEMRATRPDLLPILYRGFPYHRRGEQPDGQAPVTPYDVPVFSSVDGLVSTTYLRNHALAGAAEAGRELTEKDHEALAVFQQIALRQQLSFRMRPGDAIILNNFVILHSRSEFKNHEEPGRRRLVLRLWLEAARNRRPIRPELLIYENQGGRHGVDRIPGRTMERTDYQNVSGKALEILKGERDRVNAGS